MAINSRIRPYLPVAKWLLLTLVILAVLVQARKLGQQLNWSEMTIRPAWLVVSTLLYIAGWLPAVWFWRELLREIAGPLSWWDVSKAYFCGHLGKYVPGKAGVIFIRAGMVRSLGVPTGPGALSAGYETLASMAAGAALGTALLPYALSPAAHAHLMSLLPGIDTIPGLFPAIVLGGSLLGVGIMSRIFHRVLKKMVPAEGSQAATLWMKQPTWLAFLLLIAGWWIHGLSMGCTIQALTPEPISWTDWPRWTAATALSIVLGFLALFSPGGLGVREWVLMEILQPAIGPLALIATILSRFIWLIGETAAAGVLYYWPVSRPVPEPVVTDTVPAMPSDRPSTGAE